jgi:hypothetical protein
MHLLIFVIGFRFGDRRADRAIAILETVGHCLKFRSMYRKRKTGGRKDADEKDVVTGGSKVTPAFPNGHELFGEGLNFSKASLRP